MQIRIHVMILAVADQWGMVSCLNLSAAGWIIDASCLLQKTQLLQHTTTQPNVMLRECVQSRNRIQGDQSDAFMCKFRTKRPYLGLPARKETLLLLLCAADAPEAGWTRQGDILRSRTVSLARVYQPSLVEPSAQVQNCVQESSVFWNDALCSCSLTY